MHYVTSHSMPNLKVYQKPNKTSKSNLTTNREDFVYISANQRPNPYLVDCSCISSCCSCEDTLCAAAARLRTLDNWDRSSAIGSMVSRVPGDSPDRADPPDEKCMLARLVLVPLTPRPGWGILRTCRTPAGSSYRLLRKLKIVSSKTDRLAAFYFNHILQNVLN